MPSAKHEMWMRVAIAAAARGGSAVSPNPRVGACVIRHGRLVAMAHHKEFGGPHAERIALEKAGPQARGATLYVTLEPCATWRKTPPCASLISKKKIKTVVIGAIDPNPDNHKKGVRFLRSRGIKVITGVLAEEVKKQNEGFFKFMTAARPFVTLKMAQTLDGKIATHRGLSRWISSPQARAFVHRLRAEQDAVLVGRNTFLKDDPQLMAPARARCLRVGKPWKIVMVSAEGWPCRARVFRDDRVTVLAFPETQLSRVMKLAQKNKGRFTLLPVQDAKGRINIKNLLAKLAAIGITKLLVEGGGELAWSFIEAGCVDRAVWIVAPKIFGGRSAKTSVEGAGISRPNQAYGFSVKKAAKCGEDWIFDGMIRPHGSKVRTRG